MSVNLSPVAGAAAQFLDNSGNVLTGGKLYTYLAGTTTPAATYTSSTGVTFHSNPIILDAAGRVPAGGEIWLSDSVSYKFVLKDANDVLIGTWDNLVGINSNFVNYTSQEEIIVATAGQTVFNLSTVTYVPGTNSLQVYVDGVNQYDGVTYAYIETDANTVTFTAGLHVGALVKFTTAVSISAGSTTADLVIYNEGAIGAVDRTVESKLQESVSVLDFGAIGDGVTDDTLAIQAALTASKNVAMPSGYTFNVNGTLNMALADASLCIESGTTLFHSATGTKCLNITGARNKVFGEGILYSDGVQDDTNAPITYSAIWIDSEGCEVRGITLQRITRCGIYFNDSGFATVNDITVDGEYDTASWLPANTVLFGVFVDPKATASQGQVLVSACKFARLVSGVGVGNFGGATQARGFCFTSNLFVDCADHGVYCDSSQGANVSSNTFDRCGSAVVVTGNGNLVSSNTITNFGTVRSVYDKVSLSIRDAFNSVISNNILVGPYGGGFSGIDLSNISGTDVSYNVIDGNTVINTGTVQGRMFVIGSSLLTETMVGNVITNNIFKGPGTTNEGVVNLFVKSTFSGENNLIANNVIHSTNQWQCLNIRRQEKLTVSNNKFIWEYNAPSAATFDVVFSSDVLLSTFRNNSFSVIGGTNVTIRGITSSGALSGQNFYTENQSTLTDSSVVAATPIFNAVISDRVIYNTWNINRVERSTAPTTGTWALGDVVYNTNPTSGGYYGWVCTVAGTPGTWNTFGLIS